jgi:folate-dependent phosphoribosylglycinamide formyltransferase PurN
MATTPIFAPEGAGRPMRVAGFMSGSGTNILRLIEREKLLKARDGVSPFEVVFIFSDRSDGSCYGESIACDTGIPYVSYDIRTFHRLKALKRTVTTPEGFEARREFDRVASTLVKTFEVDVIALGGYMSYLTLDGNTRETTRWSTPLPPERAFCDLRPSGRIGAWTPALS